MLKLTTDINTMLDNISKRLIAIEQAMIKNGMIQEETAITQIIYQ